MTGFTASVELTDADQRWGEQVRPEIDAAISQFVKGFVAAPYRHRVEHSLHSDLMAILRECPVLNDGVLHLANHHQSKLIHKEWPAQRIHEGQSRRANIDVVVLPPRSKDHAVDEREFRTGSIAACAAVEIGLDYDIEHFRKDLRKLRNVDAPMRYLVHFCRKKSSSQTQVRDKINELRANDPDVQSGSLKLVAAFPNDSRGFNVLLPGTPDWLTL
ncbi:hypothetical protein [Planctellipticum variicoloris]|uniref:hypothetical protein n=1 Tax=Planctellipticum variicoloris TaxID=3064265 RepID=UPI0030140317|nr:hypothetical protein SH412_004544 [Planctomycetaceae bacterium SH412]